MKDQLREKSEALKSVPEVKEALDQATPKAEAQPRRSGIEIRLAIYLLLGLAAAGFYFASVAGNLKLSPALDPTLQRVSFGLMAVFGVLLGSNLFELALIGRFRSRVTRFELRRVLKLITALVVAGIGVSVLFDNWQTAAVSLGLLSLILGFALQTPISSLIAWAYILIRRPFRVGDRIKIGEATGDVIDVGYLDTTLWEFRGDYLSTDHPTGRLIKIPNSNVINSAVYNYSWPLFPYIWNEIKFHIGYESDLEFVANTMQEITEAELGKEMMERVQVFRELLAHTHVDSLEVREKPAVFFRVSENTWLEAIVRYLVHPKDAGRVKSRLIVLLLKRLNSQPEKVLFPKSNLR